MVFEVQDGTVTVHAQVAFEGEATDFAWVLPAPGIPEVFLSWEGLFTSLEAATAPIPILDVVNGSCGQGQGWFDEVDADADTDADSDVDTDLDLFVDVLATTNVGPYEGFVLDATDSVALTLWLQQNDFAVPGSFVSASASYLANGMNFLALKLQKGATVGDLKPLGVRWAGDRPSVPITLTSIAATPDMPLTVYVFGPSRAVPLSYLHVQLNPLVFDWFDHGLDWVQLVGRASDEAGGRAFATTYAGPASDVFVYCDGYQPSGLEVAATALDWFSALPGHGFPGTDEVLDVLRIYVPAPPTVNELSFYNNPAAYPTEWAALDATFDAIAATQALTDLIVVPCEAAEAMVGRSARLTRLVSTLSPDEMQVDPVFGFNPDLPDVDRRMTATYDFGECVGPRTLTLPGGYVLHPDAFDAREFPSMEWQLAQLAHHALVIEQLSESGPGEVVADYRAEFAATTTTSGTGESGDTGEASVSAERCGCQSSTGPVWVVAALAAVRVRRRRR